MTTNTETLGRHIATVTDYDGSVCARLIGLQQCNDDCTPANCEIAHEREV